MPKQFFFFLNVKTINENEGKKKEKKNKINQSTDFFFYKRLAGYLTKGMNILEPL